MSLNFSDFIKVKCNVSSKGKSTFLIDTQAGISLIKYSSLLKNLTYNKYDYFDITGITDVPIRSLGSINSELLVNDYPLPQKLHVVPDDFNIPSDGILGKDFLKMFQCDICYHDMTLSLNTDFGQLTVEIFEGPDEDTFVIPPRCEVVRSFSIKFDKNKSTRYAPTQELAEGVFTTNTIVDATNPFVRIVNTTDESKIIDKTKLMTNDIRNYQAYAFDQVNPDRTKKLVDILTQRVPDYVKTDFSSLCAKYSEIFALEGDTMTVNNFYTQKLRVTDTAPIHTRNYRLPHTQKSEIDHQVNTFLQNGLIEPSMSNYNSPILLVPKKAKGKWRMCIDYRLVNKKIIADRFPLPRIDEILDGIGRTRYFSILDLFQGFHQVPLDEESRDITSFSTDQGSFRWKVLPFGLNVAPNSFSRMMSIAFSGLSPTQCFLYMDDLIVIGVSEKHHLQNLESVFKSCQKFNLKLNPHKCQFFRPEVTYLGHRCTQKGVLPDESKIITVENYPTPTNKDSVKRFVAFANYYRKFINNFASIAHPLNILTRKKSTFNWTTACEKSFNQLKQALIKPPVLQYPDFSKQFRLTVDASKYGTGAILSQMHDNDDLPIAYASKTFTKGEANKATIEQELIAIHFAINYFRPYIYGTEFIVKSDHRPLIYLYGLKDPSSKLTRIRLELEEYNFIVEHIKGTDNVGADALSRMSSDALKSMNTNAGNVLVLTRSMTRKINKTNNEYRNEIEINDNVSRNLLNKKEIKINIYEELGTYKYDKIPRIKILRRTINCPQTLVVILKKKKLININLTHMELSERSSLAVILSMLETQAELRGLNKMHVHENDELFKHMKAEIFKEIGNSVLNNLQILITKPVKEITNENEKLAILKQFHDDPVHGGHCGQRRLYAKIRSRYYWKSMFKTIKTYVQTCHDCQTNKSYTKTKEELAITPTPQTSFDIVTIDTIGPLPLTENQNRYAVTMICNLTKYLISVAVPNKESRTIAKAIFNSFIAIYGPMKHILTDLGSEYKNQTLEELCKILQIDLIHSTAYHHETLGTIERNHRTLNEYLRSYLNDSKSDWEDYLMKFTYCYNITPNSSLNLKYTPYELVFGKSPRLLDILKDRTIDPLYNIENYAKELKYRLQIAHNIAHNLLEIKKTTNKKFYDKNLNLGNFAINDKVLITNEDRHKLDSVYKGPYIVTNILDKNLELLDVKNNNISTVHKNRARKYISK